MALKVMVGRNTGLRPNVWQNNFLMFLDLLMGTNCEAPL